VVAKDVSSKYKLGFLIRSDIDDIDIDETRRDGDEDEDDWLGSLPFLACRDDEGRSDGADDGTVKIERGGESRVGLGVRVRIRIRLRDRERVRQRIRERRISSSTSSDQVYRKATGSRVP
jgi:hypothetical protein